MKQPAESPPRIASLRLVIDLTGFSDRLQPETGGRLLAEGLAELDERGFRSAQVSGQAQIEPRMLAKVRLGHVPPYANGRRLLRYVEMVRAGDVAPERTARKPERTPGPLNLGQGPAPYYVGVYIGEVDGRTGYTPA